MRKRYPHEDVRRARGGPELQRGRAAGCHLCSDIARLVHLAGDRHKPSGFCSGCGRSIPTVVVRQAPAEHRQGYAARSPSGEVLGPGARHDGVMTGSTSVGCLLAPTERR